MWLVLLGACGPNHPNRPAARPCAESQAARAEGTYAGEADYSPAMTQAFRVYGASCQKMCDGGETGACLEAALLGAEGDSILMAVDPLVGLCDRGEQPACDWVAAHQESVNGAHELAAEQLAKRQAAAAEAPATTSEEVAAFAEYIKGREAGDGDSLLSDEVYGLDGGYTAFYAPMDAGKKYLIVVIGRDTTFFTGKLTGYGAETLYFQETTPQPDGVFAESLYYDLGDATANNPQVVVTPNGGDWGDVRVLIFSN